MEILAAVIYVKNISKKKVTFPRIESDQEKIDNTVNKEGLINVIDDLASRGNLKAQGDEAIIYYYIPNQYEVNVLTSNTHEMDSNHNQEKEVATDNILNVTPLLGDMVKDSTPTLSDTDNQQSLDQLSGNFELIANEIRLPKIF